MGLIKATLGAVGGTLADQWLEFFSCDALDGDTLVARGFCQSSKRSANKKGHENVISNGSGIVVADGQCMMIVEQGKVLEICAEPGEYTYDNTLEPSIFSGELDTTGLDSMFQTMIDRFTFGGGTGRDQRVYYFNTKEIMDNKFGTATPILFRVVDKNSNIDREVQLRCNGVYSYKITNPMLFYSEVCGNVESYFDRSEIDSQLKGEFISALQPAFAKLSAIGLRPSEIPAHSTELEDAMNEALTKKWSEKRGITVKSVAMNPITLRDEDLAVIQKMQDRAVLKDSAMAAASLASAQVEAMEKAASNSGGAMMGYMGMGMAAQAGGIDANQLYQQNIAEKQAQTMTQNQNNQQDTMSAIGKSGENWICSCGAANSGKFCMECGNPKPVNTTEWTCSKCGTVNKGKFCMECGSPKPAGTLIYKCDKCGWELKDPANPPKFCPECGNQINVNDMNKN